MAEKPTDELVREFLRRQASKGGKVGSGRMTAAQRTERARRAARARWGPPKPKPSK